MTTFQERLEAAAKLEKPFIKIFNEQCATHQIVKFGAESARADEFHDIVKHADDPTSRFIRFLPNSVIIREIDDEQSRGPKTALIEFNVQNTLIEWETFFRRIRQKYEETGNRRPPLINARDIFSIERDPLALYKKLASEMDVVVVVVAWQSLDNLLRAQYVNEIVVANEHTPSPLGRGSGTPIANTHFGTYQDAADFFEREFGIERTALDSIKDALINAT